MILYFLCREDILKGDIEEAMRPLNETKKDKVKTTSLRAVVGVSNGGGRGAGGIGRLRIRRREKEQRLLERDFFGNTENGLSFFVNRNCG